MADSVNDVKPSGLPARTGPILNVVRRGKGPGDRVAFALAVPTVRPGANPSGKRLNDYADARRASFGFVKDSGAGAGWHCTPPGVFVQGGRKRCGKATCRFCWAGKVGELLDGLQARKEACDAAGAPCSFRFVRIEIHVPAARYGSLTQKALSDARKSYKAEVDALRAGSAAGAWLGLLLLPYPAETTAPRKDKDGSDCDGILHLFGVKVFEGPAVRSVLESQKDRRELDVPGELFADCLKPGSPLVGFFAPRIDPADLPAPTSKHVRDVLGSAKRVTAYGTLRPKRWGEPISGNGDGSQAADGARNAGDEVETANDVAD